MLSKGIKIIYIILTSILVLSIGGIVTFSAILNNNKLKDNVTITFNNQISKDFNLEIDNLNPGEKSNYTINLKSKNEGEFSIKSSIENAEGELLNYLSISILYQENKLVDEVLLKDYVRNPYSFNIDFFKGDIRPIEYIYSIDESYGNNVENLSASFAFVLEVKKVI